MVGFGIILKFEEFRFFFFFLAIKSDVDALSI